MRARSGKTVLRRRARLRKLTKGYRASRGNLVRQMKNTLVRAGVFAYRDRKQHKRNIRKLWILRINAACRMRGLRYSQFIAAMQRARIDLDRRSLSEIAINDPASFDQLCELAKKNLPPQQPAGEKQTPAAAKAPVAAKK
jgi:large subunit ribosomal protein L20